MPITRCASHVSNPQIRTLLQRQAIENFYLPFRSSIKHVASNSELRDFVARQFDGQDIIFLEFGVASGSSMRDFAARFKNPDSKFFGFDSFVGLPETWAPHEKMSIPIGGFSVNGKFPVINDGRITFVEGWIQNTLPPFLSSGQIGGPRPHVIHFDIDLYSTTLFILTTLWHFLPDYYFIMDEYPFDEIIALRDFVNAYPVEMTYFAEHGDKNFGRIRRVPFSLA